MIMAGIYTGKICDKHPDLLGERKVNNRSCTECDRIYKRGWAKRLRNRDRAMSMVYSRLRQQKITQAMPVWADVKKIAEIYNARLPGEHVDHIIPLKGIDPVTREHVVCGLHVHQNLQIVPADENGAKWAYYTPEKD